MQNSKPQRPTIDRQNTHVPMAQSALIRLAQFCPTHTYAATFLDLRPRLLDTASAPEYVSKGGTSGVA